MQNRKSLMEKEEVSLARRNRWARARTMAFYLLVATLSTEVGAFSPQLLSSSLLSLMPRKHQKSAHTLAIHRDCLAKSALPRTQAPYLSAPWSRRSCGRCRSPCKIALDSDGDDILYSSRDGEKSVSGSSDLTQAVEIAEQQRFIPNYNIDALGGKPMVVGLAGGTGSGKSTIMKIILEQTNSKDIDHERDKINFDHPDSLETDLMVSHLEQLLRGEPVECPVYDFATHLRKANQTIRVEPRPIVLVEGILIFTDKALRDRMNLKIYVDVEADRRILRRIQRDIVSRGRSLSSIVSQYLETVKPMHDQYVEPSKQFADLIVPHGAENVAAIQVLLERLRAHSREHALLKEEEEEYRLAQMETDEDKFEESRYDGEL